MEQIKCAEVYRDADGNFNYVCTCCTFEFLSAAELEEHIVMHLSMGNDFIKEEEDEMIDDLHTIDEKNIRIEIEPVLVDANNRIVDANTDEDDEITYEDAEFIIDTMPSVQDILNELSESMQTVFRCDCCDKMYACRGLRQQHIHNYSDENKSCKQCPAYYEKESELNAHKKVHNLANTLECPHCAEIFASVNKFKRHLTSSQRELGISSAKRSRKINQPKPKIEEEEEDEEIDIDDDGMAEDDIEIEEGGDKKRQKFVCKLCQKEYSYLHYLKKHMKRHSENTLNHSCDVCGREFKLRQNLTAHIRTHTGEKPFKCRLCGKAFNQPYYMTIHMRIHQKEKPYTCDLCGVSFVTSSHLGRHMKGHNNIKPHKCDFCERAFILPGHLQDHIRSQHTGERPFECEICGNTFSRRKLLRQHKQLHGEKRFKCKYCDLVFSQSAGRRGHEIRMHNAA